MTLTLSCPHGCVLLSSRSRSESVCYSVWSLNTYFTTEAGHPCLFRFRSFLFTVGPHRVSGSKTTQALPPSQQVRAGPWHQGAPQLSSQHSLILRQGLQWEAVLFPVSLPQDRWVAPFGYIFHPRDDSVSSLLLENHCPESVFSRKHFSLLPLTLGHPPRRLAQSGVLQLREIPIMPSSHC